MNQCHVKSDDFLLWHDDSLTRNIATLRYLLSRSHIFLYSVTFLPIPSLSLRFISAPNVGQERGWETECVRRASQWPGSAGHFCRYISAIVYFWHIKILRSAYFFHSLWFVTSWFHLYLQERSPWHYGNGKVSANFKLYKTIPIVQNWK